MGVIAYRFALDGQTYEIEIEEHPDVLTPSVYARHFAEEILKRDLTDKLILDVGCGSGILSIAAALRGARVWALDISEAAVRQTGVNAKGNGVSLEVLGLSDVFSYLETVAPSPNFDRMIVNHPSLPGKDAAERDRRGYIEWNQNGDGRYVLDKVLIEGRRFLTEDGAILTHSSSEQNWIKTQDLLDVYWPNWSVFRAEELPIEGAYYDGVLQKWIESGGAYYKSGRAFHDVKFLEIFA